MTPARTTSRKRACPKRFAPALAAIAAVCAGGVGGVLSIPSQAVHAGKSHRATSSAEIAKRATGAVGALVAWEARHLPTDYVRFIQSRDAVADLIASEIGLVPTEVRAQLSETTPAKQHAVLVALSQLGVPYRSMRSEPGKAFDCSGLTSYAYAEAGITVPRSSGDQIRASDRVDRTVAEAGDLVHYPGHVGIYLGGNIYVHSPEPGRTVEIVEMPDRSLSFGDVSSL